MKKKTLIVLFLLISTVAFSQIQIQNSETKEAVSFATISFGNGNGVFADDEGTFIFTKKMYHDIDTLTITALGYKRLKIATLNLPELLPLTPSANRLEEVIIQVNPSGKFKIQKIKPIVHQDYFNCWLPTIESEIAVFFPKTTHKPTKVSKLYFPIKNEAKNWRKRKNKNTKKRPFSTLFKVHFYENENGFPGDVLSYEKIIFRVTEQKEEVFELDIDKNNIYLPKNGLFVSIQALGYTDKRGKLLPNKKYREIKTSRGIVKISTTFRPLLPFTNKITNKNTFVKRIFLNNNKWLRYEKKNIKNSKLLTAGMNNYGIGLELKVYQKNKKQ